MSIQKKTKYAVRNRQKNLLNAVLPCICIIIALIVIFFPIMPGSDEPEQQENKGSEERKIGSMTREQYMKALERELRIREKERRKRRSHM